MYQTTDIEKNTKLNPVYLQFNFDMNVNYQSINVDDDEIRDTLFRQQVLQFFKIEDYNEPIIDIKINHLKPIIERNEKLKELSIKFSNIMLQDKFDIGIIMFFAYDYFQDSFLLLKEYLSENKINKDIYDNLIKKL
jgi:hypothetical protein